MITLRRDNGLFIVRNSETFERYKFKLLVNALTAIFIMSEKNKKDNTESKLKRFNEWSEKPCPKWLFYTMFIITILLLIIINL